MICNYAFQSQNPMNRDETRETSLKRAKITILNMLVHRLENHSARKTAWNRGIRGSDENGGCTTKLDGKRCANIRSINVSFLIGQDWYVPPRFHITWIINKPRFERGTLISIAACIWRLSPFGFGCYQSILFLSFHAPFSSLGNNYLKWFRI